MTEKLTIDDVLVDDAEIIMARVRRVVGPELVMRKTSWSDGFMSSAADVKFMIRRSIPFLGDFLSKRLGEKLVELTGGAYSPILGNTWEMVVYSPDLKPVVVEAAKEIYKRDGREYRVLTPDQVPRLD